jgi:cell division protease FtsH
MERTECFTKALVRLKMPVDETFDVSRLAKMTAGMSFADCEGVLNEGAMIAARSNSTCVTMEHASMGRDRVRMGITRTGIVLNEKERRITAYHESGHVLVALMRPNSDPIERVTILPFGRSLGHMMRIPAEDRYMHSVGYLRDLIMVLLAGREAERMIFGEENVTNGAAEDFREATNLSRHMICTAGMDAVIGSVTIEPDQFGRLPDSVAMLVLERTRTMIALLAEEVRQALDGQRETLHKIAESLLSAETLDGDQVREIFSRFGSRDIQAWAASAPSNIS